MGLFRRIVRRVESSRRRFFDSVDRFNENNEVPYSFDKDKVKKKRSIFDDDEDED